MWRLWILTATVLLSLVSIGAAAVVTPERSRTDQSDAAAAEVNEATQAVLPDVRVGFEVFDRFNGTVLTRQDADRQFAAMSVVKLLIALDALVRDDGGSPDRATRRELYRMLADSDDQIANELWTAGGGPTIVTRMSRLLDLTGTRGPNDPGTWGDTLTTPRDVVTVYRYITDHLPQADQDLVLGALADSPQIAADGFDQYFGIPEGMPSTSWAVKQGWGTSGSWAVMNSTGLVGPQWRYVVVVLTSAPVSSSSRLPAVLTAGAGALESLVSAAVP
ncbi:MAG: serine hydrolase [Pseudonocardiaceae bacterium]